MTKYKKILRQNLFLNCTRADKVTDTAGEELEFKNRCIGLICPDDNLNGSFYGRYLQKINLILKRSAAVCCSYNPFKVSCATENSFHFL